MNVLKKKKFRLVPYYLGYLDNAACPLCVCALDAFGGALGGPVEEGRRRWGHSVLWQPSTGAEESGQKIRQVGWECTLGLTVQF